MEKTDNLNYNKDKCQSLTDIFFRYTIWATEKAVSFGGMILYACRILFSYLSLILSLQILRRGLGTHGRAYITNL